MNSLLHNPRIMPALLVIACLGALGTALASQYWGGLSPCVLCIYQRYAYGAAMTLAAVAFLVASSPLGRRLALAGSGLAFLAGSAIAAFHVGVEQKWWEGTAECQGMALPENATVEQLRDILLNKSFAACDQVPWDLFGISIAGYNVLACALLAALSFWAASQPAAAAKRGAA